jgi:glycosyltransferase involved in cell wall biosynthesis
MSVVAEIENPELPKISCVCIFRQLNHWLLSRLIKSYQDQSYPNRELILVYNSDSTLAAANLRIPEDKSIRVVDTGRTLSAGTCRNIGMSAARGPVVAQFDLDYWHHPERLATQLQLLDKYDGHVCMLARTLVYSYISGYAGYLAPPKKCVLNSMMLVRSQDDAYGDLQKREELSLLNRLMHQGRKPIAIDRPHLMMKLVHAPGATGPAPEALSDLPELELIRDLVNGEYAIPRRTG